MRVRSSVWLVVLLARAAHAEPEVLLVETRDSPPLPALAAQVELHATRQASVGVRAERAADPLTYADRAAQLVASGAAALVIWTARTERGLLVFAAGRWPGRAIIELVRVGDTLEPAEIERTIALKIAGLLDTLLAPRATVRDALGMEGEVRPAPPRPAARWRLEVAGFVAREPRQRAFDGRATVSVSRAWSAGGWTFAPALAAHWQPSGTAEGTAGRASVTEVGSALGVEASRTFAALEVFARPRLVVAALVAAGESRDGRRGTATVVAPYGGLELGARREISESAWVGLTGGGELAMIHHELVIDGETIVDLGRARLHVGISLTVSL